MMENQGLPTTKVPRYFSLPKPCPVPSTNENSRPVGLQNSGYNCWFNSAVQILYHIPTFRQMILEFQVPSVPIPSMEVLVGLQELFISIMYSDRKLIDPTRAVNSIGKLLGQGQGQQDASEFLGILLNRIREISPSIVEKLFVGSCTDPKGTTNNQFTQYVLQVNQDTTLIDLLESSFRSKKKPFKTKLTNLQHSDDGQDLSLEKFKQSFSRLPPVFLIDLCRLNANGSNPTDFVKSSHRMAFQSLIFMDRFQYENSQQALNLNAALEGLIESKEDVEVNFKSLEILLQNMPQLQAVYENYQRSVGGNTTVNFDLLRSLNLSWETEIQSKMNELHLQSKLLERQVEQIRGRESTVCRPYQLHAVIVHQGQSDGGHYWIYVWDSRQNIWYHIDDNCTRQVSWDCIVNASYGGSDKEESAHSLIYIDAHQIYSVLDLKQEYDIGPTDVLRYLKDHTDVRTRHSAYGKSQTIAAVHATISAHGQHVEPSILLFQALDSERQRLYTVCQESVDNSVEEEARLLHFGVYLLANQVEFEPFIYWALLQHFSSFALLIDEGTSRICTAARRILVFLECSTTQEQKKLFIQWNTAYYQFRLIIRHVMNGITHVFSRNFSAAVPLAVKALYLHHCLVSSSLKGPAMSVNQKIIHSLIDKSVTALSEELLEKDLEAVGELACAVLFDAIINWCEYADANNLEAARCSSRRIANRWILQVKHYAGHAVKCASASGQQTLAEIQQKLLKVEWVLNNPNAKDNPTPFDFKGHIPESPEDGEKLALKWKQMWLICMEQSILGP